VDGVGNVHTTGRFAAAVDFDPGGGTANLTSAGSFDVFVSKLDSSGDYVWARHWGGTDADYGLGIAVDGSGNVHTIGEFQGTVDFDPGAGTASLASSGSWDVFVSKLDSSGDYGWARHWGSTDGDNGYGIGLDGFGGVLTAGRFQGTVDFDPGPGTLELTSSGTYDAFVTRLVQPATCNGLAVTWDMNTQGAFTGTTGDDVVLGTDGPDVIDTGFGNDTVCAGAGDDVITTRAGVDWVDGGDGADVIRLGARNDTAYGGAGADVINGGGGVDYIEGGPDDDVIWDSFGADTQVYGGLGDDLFVVGRGDANQYKGGEGSDRIDYRFMPAGVTISLNTGTTNRGVADTFSSIEEARGSRHTDVITGDDSANILVGFSGHDWIHGQGGDDNLVGDKGDDTLNGGDGWDRLVGGDYGETTGDYCLEGENIHPTCEHTTL
jgi:Ca2+-binding RTX toxin-like protein